MEVDQDHEAVVVVEREGMYLRVRLGGAEEDQEEVVVAQEVEVV